MLKEVAIIAQVKEACLMIGILIEAQETEKETETMNQGQEVPLETTNEIMTVKTIITDLVPRLLEIIISEIMMIEVVIEGMIEEMTEVLVEVGHLEVIGVQEEGSEAQIGVQEEGSEAQIGAQEEGSEAIEGLTFEKIAVEEAATEVIEAPEVVLEDLTGTGNNISLSYGLL